MFLWYMCKYTNVYVDMQAYVEVYNGNMKKNKDRVLSVVEFTSRKKEKSVQPVLVCG